MLACLKCTMRDSVGQMAVMAENSCRLNNEVGEKICQTVEAMRHGERMQVEREVEELVD